VLVRGLLRPVSGAVPPLAPGAAPQGAAGPATGPRRGPGPGLAGGAAGSSLALRVLDLSLNLLGDQGAKVPGRKGARARAGVRTLGGAQPSEEVPCLALLQPCSGRLRRVMLPKSGALPFSRYVQGVRLGDACRNRLLPLRWTPPRIGSLTALLPAILTAATDFCAPGACGSPAGLSGAAGASFGRKLHPGARCAGWPINAMFMPTNEPLDLR
jgi:hypothetical protein